MKTKVNNKAFANKKADTKIDNKRHSMKPATVTKSDVTLEEEFRRNFLHDSYSPVSSKNTAYIRKEYHEMIMVFLKNVHKGNLTLSGFIDNVLAHHILTYRGIMAKMYKEARSKDDFTF